MPKPTPTALLTTLALFLLLTTLTLTNLAISRLYRILTRPKPQPHIQSTTLSTSTNPQHHIQNQQHARNHKRKGRLLILLGSGGHTSEMLAILRTLGPEYLDTRFNRRTWVVSSGDGFSAGRAGEFEEELRELRKGKERGESGHQDEDVNWDIVTVRRARNVHQSLLTTPVSAVGCLFDCLQVLRGTRSGQGSGSGSKMKQEKNEDNHDYDRSYPYPYPDLILTNGPGTGVIMVLASLILLFLGVAPVRLISKFKSTSKNQTQYTTTKRNHNQITTPTNSQSTSTPPTRNTLTNPTTHTGPETKTQPEEVGSMRTIYIESWARVKTLSLSGRILRFLATRVLVQWRGVGEVDRTFVEEEHGGEGEGVGKGEKGELSEVGGRGVGSMRIEKRGEGSGRGGADGYAGSIWPRKTEYIGAVVT